MSLFKRLLEMERLDEAKLVDLYSSTQNDPDGPRYRQGRDLRGLQLQSKVRYFGLTDENCTLNFKVNSQTNPGKFHYAYIEVPGIDDYRDLYSKIMPKDITQDLFTINEYNDVINRDDIRVQCSCQDFLYYSFQYKATQGDYEIEIEDRAPERNNTALHGALCKHLCAIVRNLDTNNKIRNQIIKDINNYLRGLAGLSHDEYLALNKAKQIATQQRAVKWKTRPSDYLNDYFARLAKHHPVLDDKDIKHGLKMDINKYIHKNPNGTVDSYLKDEWNMDKAAIADEMNLPMDEIDSYFDELGFTSKAEKQQRKINNIDNTTENIPNEDIPEDNSMKPNILNKN